MLFIHLDCFGVCCRVVCPLLNIMELDGLLLLKDKKRIHFENSTAMSFSRNHDPVTQDNLQTLLWAVSYIVSLVSSHVLSVLYLLNLCLNCGCCPNVLQTELKTAWWKRGLRGEIHIEFGVNCLFNAACLACVNLVVLVFGGNALDLPPANVFECIHVCNV